MISRFIWWFVQSNPFGYYAVFKMGDLTIKVDKQFWVHICCENSKDMLPLTFCSPKLVDAFNDCLSKKWYVPKPTNVVK